MPRIEIDLNPVSHITTDAIGPPGKRVFYIQGQQGSRTITLIVEKIQIQSLSIGAEQFLEELYKKKPTLPEASAEYLEDIMRIHPPIDPLFRVGEVGLGYDSEKDLIVILTREILNEDQDPDEADVVRFWCTRSQLRAMGQWGIEVASRGRPICPQCHESEDPKGHFCVKKNGGHLREQYN